MRRLLLLLLVCCAVTALRPGTALAHNSLDSSEPADGTVLDSPPSQVVWFFANDVPLDTLTVTLTDPSGVRTEIPGSTHGSSGTSEVLTPLPPLSSGEFSVRWRLVGPDGHPVTDSVTFTISPPATTEAPATTAAATAPPATTLPPPTTVPTTPPASSAGDGVWSTPGAFRWIVRGTAYLAIMVAAGTVLTRSFVQRQRGVASFERWLGPALALVGLTAGVQLVIVASDISGRPLWESLPDVDRALTTTAGIAFFVRVWLAIVGWLLVVHAPPRTREVRSNVLLLVSLSLLGTWSFAGHSRSMRWPALGVPLDVVHHGAAAAWLGGLTIIGLVVLPRCEVEQVGPMMRRFSTTAAVAVALIVSTGLLQAVRLVGSPGNLFDAGHGRLLAAKVVVLGAMLWVADRNRRRVDVELRNVGAAVRPDVDGLRRIMALELLIGLVIIGLTAAMVVSAPATSGLSG